jgi:hypothetical protein
VILEERMDRDRRDRVAKVFMVHVCFALDVVVDADFFADIEVKGSYRNF